MTDIATKRRRNAANRRNKITREGRRIDLLLPAEPAAALAILEQRTGQKPTQIIAGMLIREAGK